MATWVDYTVGGIIIAIALAIFYKGLKEPLDLLFGLIGRGLLSIKDKLTGTSESYQVIKYG